MISSHNGFEKKRERHEEKRNGEDRKVKKAKGEKGTEEMRGDDRGEKENTKGIEQARKNRKQGQGRKG